MNAVVYYSGSGQTKKIAEKIAESLNFACFDLLETTQKEFNLLVVAFPIYCQNCPEIVKSFLSFVKCDSLALIATYGRMGCGNALWEIARDYSFNIIAGAYIPTAHSYLTDDKEFDNFSSLYNLQEKILNGNSKVVFPKLFKNPFASFFKDTRSRVNLKIIKNNNCISCGECNKKCPYKAINNGKTNKNCIRCLKCVSSCKQNALFHKKGVILNLYLKKKKQNKLIIYT